MACFSLLHCILASDPSSRLCHTVRSFGSGAAGDLLQHIAGGYLYKMGIAESPDYLYCQVAADTHADIIVFILISLTLIRFRRGCFMG